MLKGHPDIVAGTQRDVYRQPESGAENGAVLSMLRKEADTALALKDDAEGALRLTRIAGSSAYFLGGVVSYSNTLKSAWVDVPAEIIESKEIYAGFIRLLQTTIRLDRCKRLSREIIVHGRAAAVLHLDGSTRSMARDQLSSRNKA